MKIREKSSRRLYRKIKQKRKKKQKIKCIYKILRFWIGYINHKQKIKFEIA